jgi:hypothetical protein
MTVSELERIWKEALVAEFDSLFRNFPGRTKENHENPQFG